MNPFSRARIAAAFAVLALAVQGVRADEAVVAVAANFGRAMARLEPAFEQASGHRLTVVLGSSGKLAAQVQQGAPFDVFLSADTQRPALLEKTGLGVAGSRFTYAVGRLALWSRDPRTIGDGPAYLRAGAFRHLAIANPAVAPYGVAARQALEKLGVWAAVRDRIVRGEDIGQVYAMVGSGAARAGLVALSAVMAGPEPGSHWTVPRALHAPLKQDAILIARARDNPAARAFVDFLRTPATRAAITDLGYDPP